MKRFLAYLAAISLNVPLLLGQSYDIPLEDLDESEVEQLEHARNHPVEINSATRAELLSSGLFTPLQINNLLEYRKRSGDILSAVELSLVDGFTSVEVAALAPFLLFHEGLNVKGFHQDFMLRGGWRHDTQDEGQQRSPPAQEWRGGCVKVEIVAGNTVDFSCSARLPDGTSDSFPLSVSVGFTPCPWIEKIVVGDYCLRFGQGMGTWTGMSIGTLSSINSFMRRPTGLKQSHSLPPSESGGSASYRRGTAAWITAGSLSFIPFISFDDGNVTSGLHAQYLSKSGEWGITAGRGMPLSLDFRQYCRGFDLFGELLPLGMYSWDGHEEDSPVLLPAFTAGTVWNISYESKLALRLRSIPQKEHSAALGMKVGGFLFSADLQMLPPKGGGQCKLLLDAPVALTGWWELKLRLKERLRSYGSVPSLTDLRLDSCFSYASVLKTNLRLEATCDRSADGWGLLGYLEQGLAGENMAVWGRVTLWNVPSWEERIYVYERDAPQCFNMRAYYRSGFSLSLYASIRTKSFGKLYMRISGKDSRLQYALSF